MTEPAIHNVMDEAEIGILLGRIAAFDARTVGQSEIQGWLLIAQRGRWTLSEATEQVINYFSTDAGGSWLMPGKINTMIRMERQDRLSRRAVAPFDPEADAQHEADVQRDRSAIMDLWKIARDQSKKDSAARRALVLRHPDLAQKLCSQLIGYSRPENWNGWIPPATVPDMSAGAEGPTTSGPGYMPNDSPRRAALVALVAEAERRETAS